MRTVWRCGWRCVAIATKENGAIPVEIAPFHLKLVAGARFGCYLTKYFRVKLSH
jgi:hypothetical protein